MAYIFGVNRPDVAPNTNYESYANLAAFPAAGEQGLFYLALDTNKIYRFDGSYYIECSTNELDLSSNELDLSSAIPLPLPILATDTILASRDGVTLGGVSFSNLQSAILSEINSANTVITYNVDGTVNTVTSDGVTETLAYTSENITSITGGGETTTIGYDASNRVNSVVTA